MFSLIPQYLRDPTAYRLLLTKVALTNTERCNSELLLQSTPKGASGVDTIYLNVNINVPFGQFHPKIIQRG